MNFVYPLRWGLLLGLILGSLVVGRAAAPRPNVIYIMLDDAGYGDFSCYGQRHFQTPNIDRIAQEGMRFTQHYAGSTVCAPTRCSLMTGLHTGHAFIRGNKEIQPEGQWPLPENAVTVPKLLKSAGYVTGMFGKWGLGGPGTVGDPVKQGWDTFYGYNCQREAHTYYPKHLWHNDQKVPLDGKTYSADLIVEQTLDFIRRNAEGSFFAYVPWTIPHAAMHVPEEDVAPFREQFQEYEDVIGRYRGPEVKNPVAAFAGMMTRVDRNVGQILDLVKELGIAENTILFFTSDNGPHLEGGHRPDVFDSNGPYRGHKRDMYEGGIRVPLLAWWPGTIAAGSLSPHISAHWDFLPTVCELAGVTQRPANLDGISMVATLRGEWQRQKKHPYLYWEFPARGSKQALRMGKWKAVRLNLAADRDAPIELYNLNRDPGETRDIAARHPKIIRQLQPLFQTARIESALFPLFEAETE